MFTFLIVNVIGILFNISLFGGLCYFFPDYIKKERDKYSDFFYTHLILTFLWPVGFFVFISYYIYLALQRVIELGEKRCER